MKFQTAYNRVRKLADGRYFSVSYQLSEYDDGSQATEIQVYLEPKFLFTAPTFAEAITQLEDALGNVSKYLEFVQVPSPFKTEVWVVRTVSQGSILGHINWYGAWRQYVFSPADCTVWNPDCLDAVNAKIRQLMEARKVKS